MTRATAPPMSYVPMTLKIQESNYQEHAARACGSFACICAGASLYLSWCAQYEYVVSGAAESGYGPELKRGKIFVKVTHDVKHYQIRSNGDERLFATYKIVEHWPVDKRTAKTEKDCLGFRLPFQHEYSCGLRSVVNTDAEIEIHAGGSTPTDTTWSSFSGMNYYDPDTHEASEGEEGSENKNDPKAQDKTPSSAEFEPPAGASGGSTSASKKLEAKPTHCDDWTLYLRQVKGGGGGDGTPPRYRPKRSTTTTVTNNPASSSQSGGVQPVTAPFPKADQADVGRIRTVASAERMFVEVAAVSGALNAGGIREVDTAGEPVS